MTEQLPASASAPASALATRLAPPDREIDPYDLFDTWFDQTVWVSLEGVGRLAENVEFLNHLRRSLGGGLGRSASPESQAGKPCPWEPPCAFDVLFREQLRNGQIGLPKPYIVLTETSGPDLHAGVRVFGLATDWMPAVEQALIIGLREILPWAKLGLDTPQILNRWVETQQSEALPTAPDICLLQWITPLDAEKHNAESDPASVIRRIVTRVKGMAVWHDSALDLCAATVEKAWIDRLVSAEFAIKRHTQFLGRQPRTLHRGLGRLVLEGELGVLWPLILMAERCFVGRGATRGMGRYAIQVADQ